MNSVTNGPQNPITKNNLPQVSAEPTSNIAAVVAAAEQALNTSSPPLQISKHLQQLRIQGKAGEITAPTSGSGTATPIINNSSMLTSSASITNTKCTITNITGRNNSIPSFANSLMNTSLDSNSSTGFNSGFGSKFSERAAAAKNRWKAKGSITQGHVPQRQIPSVSGSNPGHNLQTPHQNLAHSHSFDDAFENGKNMSSSGSAQLLHRRHTHHR